MIFKDNIYHYKEISVNSCINCDTELCGIWYCDYCADIEYKKMRNAGWDSERILVYIDKYHIIHNFNEKRLEALLIMV